MRVSAHNKRQNFVIGAIKDLIVGSPVVILQTLGVAPNFVLFAAFSLNDVNKRFTN